jgi:hypothetical protein
VRSEEVGVGVWSLEALEIGDLEFGGLVEIF